MVLLVWFTNDINIEATVWLTITAASESIVEACDGTGNIEYAEPTTAHLSKKVWIEKIITIQYANF